MRGGEGIDAPIPSADNMPACINAPNGLRLEEDEERTVLDLSNLRELSGDLVIRGNPFLTAIHAPMLQRVEGNLIIDSNPNLATVSLEQALIRVSGDLGVWRNPLLLAQAFANVSADGERSLSANGCSMAADCGALGGDLACDTVFDPAEQDLAFGGGRVCHECNGSSVDTCETGEVCDAIYEGPGTGTYRCVPSADAATP